VKPIATKRGGERPARTAARLPATALLAALAGCQPRVALEAPQEPIVIHMNIKIEHDIRVRVDRELEQLFAAEKDIF
jgi:hypothetical protein